MLRHRSLLISLGLVLVVATACGASAATTARTPEAAVEQLVRQRTPANTPPGFIPVQTRMYDLFAVVLYHQPHEDPSQALSYKIAHQNGEGWYTKECCDGGSNGLRSAEEVRHLLQFAIAQSAQPRFIYGRVLAPQITAVEATFADQQTIRAPVIDGLFIVLSATSRNICVVRALDMNTQVLGQFQLGTAEGCENH